MNKTTDHWKQGRGAATTTEQCKLSDVKKLQLELHFKRTRVNNQRPLTRMR